MADEIPHIQTSFNSGEISPQVTGRVELAKYSNAVKTLENMIPLVHGPSTKRPGFEFISETKDPTPSLFVTGTRLVPFEFSTTQAYMLEFGDEYIRFYKDGAVIVKTAANTEAWLDATGYVVGDFVKHGASVIYRCIHDHTSVAGAGAGSNEPGVGVDEAVEWVADDTYELALPYAYTDLAAVDYAQSADVLYLAHGDWFPRELTRTDHDLWTLTLHDPIEGPWESLNITETEIQIDVETVGAGRTATATASLFTTDDVGRLLTVMIANGGDDYWGVAIITAWTSATVVTVTTIRAFGAATTDSRSWKLGAWCVTNGYPKTVCFQDDRLSWGGSPGHPQSIWRSKVNSYTDYGAGVDIDGLDQTITDEDALNLVLGAKQVNSIQWMESVRKLAIGTLAAEWWLTSASGEGAMTANSKLAVDGSHHGSEGVFPTVVGNIIIFAVRHNKIIMELRYSYEEDTFIGKELNILAEHLFAETTIREMTYQNDPFRTIWIVTAEGRLIGCTYNRAHDVVGWHRHPSVNDDVDAVFESCAVIPGSEGDELWVTVNRYIGGAFVRHVERLASRFVADDSSHAFCVDAGLTYDERIVVLYVSTAVKAVITTWGNHGYAGGEWVIIRDTEGLEDADGENQVNYNEYEVEVIGATSFYLKDADGAYLDTSALTAHFAFSGRVGEMATTISGLDHLEGETVQILADGAPLADQVVSSGQITIDGNGASVVHAGLGYTSKIETLNPELITATARTSLLDRKKITKAVLRLHNSIGGQIGHDEDNLKDILQMTDAVPMGRPPALKTGLTDLIDINGEWGIEVGLTIQHSQPLPFTLLSMTYLVDRGD